MQVTDEMIEAALCAFTECPSSNDLDAMHTALTAALAKAWEPIESAPRDGTRVILFTKWLGDKLCPDPFDEVQVGYWDDGNQTHDVWHREPGWVTEFIGTPTHWIPLPAPPATKGAGER